MNKSDLLRKAAGALRAEGYIDLAVNIRDLDEKTECGIAAWNGTGLPPVGCECEARYKDADSAEWFFFRVLAIDCGHLFGWAGKDPCAIDLSEYELRPIRTEAEKRRDSTVEKIWAAMDEVERLLVDAGFTRGGDKKKAP